jgi:hypothetical protein
MFFSTGFSHRLPLAMLKQLISAGKRFAEWESRVAQCYQKKTSLRRHASGGRKAMRSAAAQTARIFFETKTASPLINL